MEDSFVSNMSQESNGDQFDDFALIDQLPNEVMIKIFGYLKLRDRKSASLVCNHWLELLSTYSLAIEYPLVLYGTFTDDDPIISMFVNSNRIFPYVKVIFQCQRFLTNGQHKYLELYGHRIKTLNLRFGDAGYTEDILEQCPELEKLILENIYLLVECETLPPKLTEVIAERGDLFEGVRLMDSLRSLTQLNKIIIKQCFWSFGDRPKWPVRCFKVDKDLRNFEKSFKREHGRTKYIKLHTGSVDLKSSKVLTYGDFINYLSNDISHISKFPNLKHIDFYGSSSCFQCHEITEMLSMKKLTIEIECEDNICDFCFGTLIKSFPNLTELNFTGSITSVNLNFLSESCQKLKALKLDAHYFSFPIDLKDYIFLQNLTNLEKLQLNECFPLEVMSRSEQLSKLKEVNFSINYETIENLENFNVNNAFGSLMMKWPNVEDCTLDIFEKRENWAILNCVTIFKQWSRLHVLDVIFRSKNSEDSLRTVLDIVAENCTFLETFRYKLNENGYRVDKIPDFVKELFNKIETLQLIESHERDNYNHYYPETCMTRFMYFNDKQKQQLR